MPDNWNEENKVPFSIQENESKPDIVGRIHILTQNIQMRRNFKRSNGKEKQG
jgi:hypothetical protein